MVTESQETQNYSQTQQKSLNPTSNEESKN